MSLNKKYGKGKYSVVAWSNFVVSCDYSLDRAIGHTEIQNLF